MTRGDADGGVIDDCVEAVKWLDNGSNMSDKKDIREGRKDKSALPAVSALNFFGGIGNGFLG